MKHSGDSERQFWLWVTGPTYYLDEDGSDREELDPSREADTEGWWTCHKDTQKGDLALLWRTAPKKDIGYLIQTTSDSYSIADDEYAAEQDWDYGCDYQVFYKFDDPVTIRDLRDDPYFDDWGPLRQKFRRRSFPILERFWNRLNRLASDRNPGYRTFIEQRVQEQPVLERIEREEQLEETLVNNLGLLEKFDYDLELYTDAATGVTGRQLICKGNGGRIDLLCYDRKGKQYVVVELKNVRASQNTFGQVANYVGWVQDRIAGRSPVIGLVISRGYDTRFESSRRVTDRIFQLNLEQLGLD